MTGMKHDFAWETPSELSGNFVSSSAVNDLERLGDKASGFAGRSTVSSPSRSLGYRVAKRTLDLALASIALVFLSPLLLIAALVIKIESPGPAIFMQRRRGLNGETFLIWKFRTMRVLEDGAGVQQARRNDARVTRFGSLLRRTSVDELPQLINVMKGEMSLVGPRPHPLSLDDKHRTIIANYDVRHAVKPGITGWAQVNGCRGETAQLSQMQARINHDLWYVRNVSFMLDLSIILKTMNALVKHEAY